MLQEKNGRTSEEKKMGQCLKMNKKKWREREREDEMERKKRPQPVPSGNI
jgi:hypothetical protein